MGKIKIPKIKGDDGYSTFSLRMPVTLCEEIDNLVRQTNLSRNEFLNMLIKEALKDVEIVDSSKER